MARQKAELTEADRAEALRLIQAANQPLTPSEVSRQGKWSRNVSSAEVVQLLDYWVMERKLTLLPADTAKGKHRYWDRDFQTVAREGVMLAICSSSEPLTAKQVKSLVNLPFKVTDAQVQEALDLGTASGELVTLPAKTKKGGLRYFSGTLTDYARDAVLETLRKKGPQIEAALRKLMPWLSNNEQTGLFSRLSQSGDLHVHPPTGSGRSRGTLWGLQPPSPDPYLAPLRTQLLTVVEKLRAAGVAEVELRRALFSLLNSVGIAVGPGAELVSINRGTIAGRSVDLLRLMTQVNSGASRGALVTARLLRQAARLCKTDFDEMAFQLAREGKVDLHEHDHPASLSEVDREEMISDGQGRYYVGLSVRT